MSRIPEKIAPDLKIDWPTKPLTDEERGCIATSRAQIPLRNLIAQLIVDEAVDLWRVYSQKYPSSRYNRCDQDLAINLGYKEVGALFLAANSRPSEQTTAALQRDPTGLAFLHARLEMVRGNGKTDPDVIGFERGVERFKDFYNMAVRSGIRSDKQGFRLPILRFTSNVRRLLSI